MTATSGRKKRIKEDKANLPEKPELLVLLFDPHPLG